MSDDCSDHTMEWDEDEVEDYQHTQTLNNHFSYTPSQQAGNDGGAEGPQGPREATSVLGDATNRVTNNASTDNSSTDAAEEEEATPTDHDIMVFANTKLTRLHQRDRPQLQTILEEAIELVTKGKDDILAPPTTDGQPPMSALHAGERIAAKKWNEMDKNTRINKLADQCAKLWEQSHPTGRVLNAKWDPSLGQALVMVRVDSSGSFSWK